MFNSNASSADGGANYIEDVFSTYLYTGTGSPTGITVNNGIDLATDGGLLWCKNRTTGATPHYLFDTARNFSYTNASSLDTASTAAQASQGTNYAKPETTGFSFGDGAGATSPNKSGDAFVSWTWRKQPKYFDIQTWTGNGANRTIAHSLGSVPGSIWVKRTDTTGAWQVYHRSLANTEYLVLNTNAAKATGTTRWNSTTPTSTVFSIGTDVTVNASAGTYVAYIFAHNAGGFGLAGTDNVISCGTFTTDASGNASVNLGYEPQFWLYKPTIAARSWTIYDVMRGWSQTNIANLNPNLTDAEGGGTATLFYPTATGFDCVGGGLDASTEHIYITIRRGPMKVPTLGTSVFSPNAYAGTSSAQTQTTNFPVDLMIDSLRSVGGKYVIDRLRGSSRSLQTEATDAEDSLLNIGLDSNTGVKFLASQLNGSGSNFILWSFRRAPSFFDEVCYTATASTNRRITHNLKVAPELIINKQRSVVSGWQCYSAAYGINYYFSLNANAAANNLANAWGTSAPTSTDFGIDETSFLTNGATQVTYLFATCAGVSKVGSYTGTGTTQTINCGFTAGSRFIMIKRTDSTGDWYVWDSARGIIAGNDPYLLLNSTAAEVTGTDYVDTAATGFELSSTAPAALNANGGTYIFLAIA
jgi:hypothetical protein